MRYVYNIYRKLPTQIHFGAHVGATRGLLQTYVSPRSHTSAPGAICTPRTLPWGHSGHSRAHVGHSGAHTRAIELLWGTRWGHTRALAGIRVPLEPYECPRSYMYVCFPRTLLARGHSGHSGAAHIGCVKAPWYYGETPNRGGGEFGSCFVTPPKCPPLVVV